MRAITASVRTLASLLIPLALAIGVVGCPKKGDGAMRAIIKTSMGEIRCTLMPDLAPTTVENFVGLAQGTKEWRDPKSGQPVKGRPLYNGTIFHRVIPNFMIQGGDPLGSGRGGPGYQFEDEVHPDLGFDRPWLLAMANSGPNTNGSQFFITVKETPWLNQKHTIFGDCSESSAVVLKIVQTPTAAQDRPRQDVVIEKIEIEQ